MQVAVEGDLEEYHKHSLNNFQEIQNGTHAGCFYCLAVFERDKIPDWIDQNKTALCPHCSVDAILSSSLFADDIEALKRTLIRMKRHYF